MITQREGEEGSSVAGMHVCHPGGLVSHRGGFDKLSTQPTLDTVLETSRRLV